MTWNRFHKIIGEDMGITIRDIAKHCGVGVATVSRTINNSGYVRADVKERIRNFIQENNWNPSTTATALSTGKSGIIGILIPSLKHYIYWNLLEKLRQRLADTSYKMMVSLSPSSDEINKFIAAKAETVIVISSHLLPRQDIQRLIDSGIRVIGLIGSENFFPTAHSNHYEATYLGTKMLIDAGHRKIAYTGPYAFKEPPQDEASTWITNALNGYLDAMHNVGIVLDFDRDLIYDGNYNVPSPLPRDLPLVQDLLRKRHSAYLVYPCETQLVFYAACRELGLRIPDDVSMLGVEGDYFAPALNPPPTHFVHSYDAFADIAMDFITLQGKLTNKQYTVSYKLIQGRSIKNITEREK